MKFISLKESKYVWLIIIALTIIAILFKSIYRQYITENHIQDKILEYQTHHQTFLRDY
jgi:hypothetical protein